MMKSALASGELRAIWKPGFKIMIVVKFQGFFFFKLGMVKACGHSGIPDSLANSTSFSYFN
jgi:hypothetical protein